MFGLYRCAYPFIQLDLCRHSRKQNRCRYGQNYSEHAHNNILTIIIMHTLSDDRIMILNSTNQQSSSSMLIIDPVLPSDSGWYTCTAFNDAGRSSQRIFVEVQCKFNLLFTHDSLQRFGNFPLFLVTFLFPSCTTCFQSNRISSHVILPPLQYKLYWEIMLLSGPYW